MSRKFFYRKNEDIFPVKSFRTRQQALEEAERVRENLISRYGNMNTAEYRISISYSARTRTNDVIVRVKTERVAVQ